MSQTRQNHFQLWGWILFIVSALFFMAASIRADDPVSLIGGALFLVACFVFMVPLLAQFRKSSKTRVTGKRITDSLGLLNKCFRYRPDSFRAVSLLLRAPAARMTPQVPAHLLHQSRHHSTRSELRFFASTR
jgi:hypothetical protein